MIGTFFERALSAWRGVQGENGDRLRGDTRLEAGQNASTQAKRTTALKRFLALWRTLKGRACTTVDQVVAALVACAAETPLSLSLQGESGRTSTIVDMYTLSCAVGQDDAFVSAATLRQ